MDQNNSFHPENLLSNQLGDSRRAFISKAAMGLILALSVGQPPIKWKSAEKNIKVILFDAFAIFDPRPILALAEKIFPGKGSEIIETWRLKQFEYTWLREVAGQYRNFIDVTTDSLLFAARKAQVRLTEADKLTLIKAHFSLDLWPDSLPTLEYLRKKTIRIGLLSNMTATMLGSCIQFNHLDKYFEAVLSTDQRKTYKPSPRAYQMGLDSFQVSKSEILFVASAGWDAAGAKWFGYPTYWVNRLHAPMEELSDAIDMNSIH